MKWTLLLQISIVFTYLHHQIGAYNVLAFFPLSLPSHIKPFQPLLYELAKRGHHVTEYSSLPPSAPIENHTFVHVPSVFNGGSNAIDFRNKSHTRIINMFHELCLSTIESVLQLPLVQTFIQKDRSHFDVIIIGGSFCGENFVALGHKYNAPVIDFQPLGYTPSASYLRGNLLSPAAIPDFRLASTANQNFWQRLSSFWFTIIEMYLRFIHYYPAQSVLMNKYLIYKGYETRPTLIDMLQNISMTFVEYDITIGIPQPLSPNIVFTGGMHIKPSKPLPNDLEKFMTEAKDGVIYISFGTILQLSSMPKNVKTSFLEAFKKIKQKIIWKNNETTENLPPNVLMRGWFPQADILGHANCKLFITHGGIHSAMESGYHGVPLVMMPGFSDQFQNVLLLEEKGLGRIIDMDNLNSEMIVDAVQEVLNNRQYAENAKRISSIMKTPQMTSLEKGVFWTEFVMRHNGAHFLKPASIRLSLFQLLGLDLLLFMLVVIVISLIVVQKLINWVLKFRLKNKIE